MSRERTQCIDALLEAENSGVWFTEIVWRYNYYSGELRALPLYNSCGVRRL